MIFISGKLFLAIVFCFLLSVVAFTLPNGFPPDYFNYIYYFEGVGGGTLEEAFGYRFEPGFALVSFVLIKLTQYPEFVFSAIVILASVLKLKFLFDVSEGKGFFLAFVLFYLKFFPLQDFNQIRAALSMSFSLLLFLNINNGIFRQVMFAVLAVSFHYSSLLLLPFIYLCKFEFTRIKIIGIAILTCILFKTSSIFAIDVFGQFFSVIDSYESNGLEAAKDAAFSPVFYPEFITIIFILFFWRDSSALVRKIFFLQVIGFSLFYGLIELNVFAIRGREFFSIFWIGFVAQYDYSRKNIKRIQVLFLLMSVALGFYTHFYLNFYTSDYRWVY